MLENVCQYLRLMEYSLIIPQLRRIRATSNQSRELPPVDMGHSVEDFFDSLLQSSNGGTKLPNWYVPLRLWNQSPCLTMY